MNRNSPRNGGHLADPCMENISISTSSYSHSNQNNGLQIRQDMISFYKCVLECHQAAQPRQATIDNFQSKMVIF